MVGHQVLVLAVGVRLPAPQQWLKIIKKRCIDTKDTLKIFSGRSNLALAQGIVDVLGMDLGNVTIRTFADGELWVKNLHINEYSNSGHKNHEPKRSRKLLLNRIELNKIESKVKEKGMSIIPIRLFSNEKGKIKLDISLAKGKKLFDKRESIKEKDLKRDIDRLKKIKWDNFL